MAKASNKVVAAINLVTFVLSLWILREGIWLVTRGQTDCQRFLQWPVIGLGAFVMMLSIAGFAGACFRVYWALSLYLFIVFSLILLILTGFTIFALAVSAKGEGRSVEGREYKEYSMGDYSEWFQKKVGNSQHWQRIKSCMKDASVCRSFARDEVNVVAEEFYKKHLTPMQSGCCKPPTSCEFKFVNATVWEKKPGPINSTDPDCNTWSNEQEKLCYDCKSCKAGVVANLKNEWHKVAIAGIAIVIALVVIYSTACCACINNQRDFEYEYGVYRMAKIGYP